MTGERLKMWCPRCDDIRPCSARRVEQADEGGGLHPTVDDEPVHGYSRIRVCSVCKSEFATVEVEESLIDELIQLRALARR